MSCSIKKVFLFFTRFSNFHDADHLLYYSPMSVFSFHTFLIPVSKTRDIERMLTLLYQYKWQKFNEMNEKRSLEYQCEH